MENEYYIMGFWYRLILSQKDTHIESEKSKSEIKCQKMHLTGGKTPISQRKVFLLNPLLLHLVFHRNRCDKCASLLLF